MAWIESHQSLRNHRKTGRLARRLGVSKVTAIGHLHCLWWWCMDNAPGGYLDGIDPEDIAEGAEWEGDPCAFIDALAFAGFLDDGHEVHDWYDYAGKLIEKRASDAARKREARRKPDDPAPSAPRDVTVPRTSGGHPEDGAGTVPNRTQPNPTQPDPGANAPVSGAAAPQQPARPVRPIRNVPKPRDQPAPQNPWWDALVAGIGVTPATDQERQLYGKAVRELRALEASPEDISARCANYRAAWPDVDLTVPALLKHWSRMEHPPPIRAIPGRNGRRPASREDHNDRAFREAFGDESGDIPEVIEAAFRRH